MPDLEGDKLVMLPPFVLCLCLLYRLELFGHKLEFDELVCGELGVFDEVLLLEVIVMGSALKLT